MDDLDTLVHRIDEDRWLASRFAPAPVRTRLVAVYAVNYEIARTAEIVRESALGDIRLEWWRSALNEIAEGGPPKKHPALEALHGAECASAARAMIGVAQARAADLEVAPFRTWDALDAYVAGTSRGLMAAALEACEVRVEAAGQTRFLDRAALAWAYVGLLRAAPFWAARGRTFLPDGATDADVLRRARGAYAEATPLARSMPAAAFPAFGYVALVPGYLRALERGGRERPLFWRQASIIAASATGRI